MKGNLFVISGPSGVGKGTLCKKAAEILPNIWVSVSMTSREIRESETENVSYFYVSQQDFFDRIQKNEFLEYVEVYQGVYYGTPKGPVFEHLNAGDNVILEIDVDGAERVRQYTDACISIFIVPPSAEELKNRLTLRDKGANKNYDERIARAIEYEIPQAQQFDYCVVNDDLDIAVQQLCDIIQAHSNKE